MVNMSGDEARPVFSPMLASLSAFLPTGLGQDPSGMMVLWLTFRESRSESYFMIMAFTEWWEKVAVTSFFCGFLDCQGAIFWGTCSSSQQTIFVSPETSWSRLNPQRLILLLFCFYRLSHEGIWETKGQEQEAMVQLVLTYAKLASAEETGAEVELWGPNATQKKSPFRCWKNTLFSQFDSGIMLWVIW
jgi:hypothetical protein